MFNLPHGKVSISGGQFTQQVHQKSAIELIVGAFQGNYIASATHDNNDILDPPKCHPGTRVSFLNQLSEWVKDTSSPVSMTWLHGPAGAGKSAIARSLADILHAEGLLAGSFFFFHTDLKRNSEKPLIVTLAQQLAVTIPETQVFIADSLSRDPTILARSLQTQFEMLIVNPIIQLTSAPTQLPTFRPTLMIVDGLDECKDPKGRHLILKTLCNAFPRLQGLVKFLITSRPEHDIQTFFQRTTNELGDRFNPIDLSTDIRRYEDIHIYLCAQFERIKREHPLHATFNWDWPPEYAIQILVEKSSGNFIYASTVIKYIENAYDRPQKCLDDVISLRKASRNPFGDLDALYLNILRSSKVDQKVLVSVLSATLVCSSIQHAFGLFWLAYGNAKYDRFVESVLLLEPNDVQLDLLDLRSIIGLGKSLYIPLKIWHGVCYGTASYPDIKRIEFWHKSFSDFLLDSVRSNEFHIDSDAAHTTVAKGCLQLLSDNCQMMEKYWPEERLCSWLRITYHHVLAHCCKQVPYNSDLFASLKNYNLLDILQIQSLESRWQEFGGHDPYPIDYFFHLSDILTYFGKARAFDGTNVYDCLIHQLYHQLRSELDIWVPPGSTLMNILKTAITPMKIDWPIFKLLVLEVCQPSVPWQKRFRIMVLSTSNPITKDPSRTWPYFLEWMFSRSDRSPFINDAGDWETIEKLVCDFIYLDYWKHETVTKCDV